jgi:hypothetical protein
MIMSFLMYDAWKGKDLFMKLSGIVDEANNIGRKKIL